MSARFVLHKSIALEQYHKLRDLGLSVSYSVKTNPLIAPILEAETDSEFSLHSMESLDVIKDKSRVWYYAQAWNGEEIARLVSRGVRHFVVDNETDLATLESYLDSHREKIWLLLRAKFKENTIFTGKHYVFGMDASAVNAAIPRLRACGSIERLGVHVHRKSQNISEWSLRGELASILTEENLKAIQMVNIGGGIPSDYSNSSDAGVPAIYEKIKELAIFLQPYGIALTVEPGRFIAAPAVALETTVKQIHGDTVIVDCSVYNSAMDTLIVPLKLRVDGELGEENRERPKRYTIKGCTPCSMDIFRYAVRLAREPKPGDTIRFLNAGAYNFATDFCSLRKLKTIVSN